MTVLDLFRLEGRVALITGASRGLGQAMAVGLAEAGADIAGLDRTPDCEETCAQVEALGRRYLNLSIDLLSASKDDLARAVQDVVEGLGRLDILVNNAGIIRRAPALDYSEADWDEVITINLRALFFLSQAAGRVMAAQGGGKIVNVASMLSFQGDSRPLVHRVEKRGRRADACARQRVGAAWHQRQRDRAGLYGDR